MISYTDLPSKYTGLYGVVHTCDRCKKIISMGDTGKKATKQVIELCLDCHAELYKKELEDK